MSAVLRKRLARPILLQRDPLLNTNRHAVRHNSTILNGLGSCVATTAESLSSLHSAGVPWYIILPLVATTLNFTIRFPAQWLSRLYRLRRNEARPLKLAWTARDLRRNVRPGQGALSAAQDLLKPRVHSKRINKDFGAPSWKSWATFLVPVVPFVLVSESVRRLAGSPMTWLGTKLGLDRFLDVLEPGASTLTDATLSNGGILWFTDLMAADPYGGLPLICAFTLGWGSWSQIGAERLKQLLSLDDKNMPAAYRLQMAIGRVLLVIPLFPLLFWNLPSAVFLYWAPTFLFNRINDALLKKWLPEPKPRYSVGVDKPLKQPPRFVGIDGYDIPPKKGGSTVQSKGKATK